MNCTKCGQSEWLYEPATNEDGWRCLNCQDKPGEPAGFCPQLDREEIYAKVESLLLGLTDWGAGKFMYVSNSDEGDHLCTVVTQRCRRRGRYDQYSICQWLFDAEKSHGDYWKGISDGVMNGNDTRKRCQCGKLAVHFVVGGENYCAAHSPGAFGSVKE